MRGEMRGSDEGGADLVLLEKLTRPPHIRSVLMVEMRVWSPLVLTSWWADPSKLTVRDHRGLLLLPQWQLDFWHVGQVVMGGKHTLG